MTPPQKPRRKYSRYVELLIGYDQSIATENEHLESLDPSDHNARKAILDAIEVLKEHRRGIEDLMRKIEPGERPDTF